MSRVFDYNSFASGRVKSFNTNMTFSCDVRQIDVDLYNVPEELRNISSVDCEVEYEISVISSKTGISDIGFIVREIELEIKVDSHPDPDTEYEIDILPGKNCQNESIICEKGDRLIPSDPSRVEIDMGGSILPRDFRVKVTFGSDL